MLIQEQLDTTKTTRDVLGMFPVFSVKDIVQSRTEIVICTIMDYFEWFSKYLPEWFTSRMFQFCQDKY